ncbi:MAG: hypothetical protein ACMXX5_01150 [Candidatus Woesearchaeota archaeon]
MIDKIKQILKSANEIEECKNELKSAKKEMQNCIKCMNDIEKSYSECNQTQLKDNEKVINSKKEAVDEIKNVAKEFQKELNDFKIIKTKLKTEIIEKVSLDIRKELDVYIMNIKQKIESLNQAAKEIEKISKDTGLITDEVKKIKEISAGIKKQDFELTKYANELRKNDSEKLNLMRKIDSLERLISKMRRQNR